jgi:hypothetical protein
MEIVPIFANEMTFEGLYAIRYHPDDDDEFERLFSSWSDVEYLTNYLKENIGYLLNPHFESRSISSLADQVLEEGEILEKELFNYANAGLALSGDRLEMIFQPLGKQAVIPIHQHTKAKLNRRKPLLRIYALRLGKNTFIITGGAIKLVHSMADHPDTIKELEKLNKVKAFLKSQGIDTDDDLTYYYEQS